MDFYSIPSVVQAYIEKILELSVDSLPLIRRLSLQVIQSAEEHRMCVAGQVRCMKSIELALISTNPYSLSSIAFFDHLALLRIVSSRPPYLYLLLSLCSVMLKLCVLYLIAILMSGWTQGLSPSIFLKEVHPLRQLVLRLLIFSAVVL